MGCSSANLILLKTIDYVEYNFKRVLIQLYKYCSKHIHCSSNTGAVSVANISTILKILIRLFVKSIYGYDM